MLHEMCEKILVEQLARWFNHTATGPADRSLLSSAGWFDYQHHLLIDLWDEPLIGKRD